MPDRSNTDTDIDDETSTTQDEPRSAGIQLLMYALFGFFSVVVLFALCMAADAMGRSFSAMGKRLLLADGSGHTSMLTECVVFVIVLVIVGVVITQAYHSQTQIFSEEEDD